MSELYVHHFGPDPRTVGGMAAVIGVLTDHQVGGDHVESHPTWTPRSALASFLLATAAARTLLRLPKGDVVHVHLSEGGSFLREGLLVAMARKRGLLTAVTIHGASFLPFGLRYPRLVSAVLRRAQIVTCLDQRTLAYVRNSAPLTYSEILPNPVFVRDDFQPADQTEELVVFAGEIGLRKGADVLCRAWQQVLRRRPDARCLLVGPVTDFTPPEMERLETRQPVDHIEMEQLLRRARVVALPTRADGMPMVLTEAMSQGRPFVSTPVGGIPQLAREGGGLLVPVDDEIALAEGLIDLLSDPALARGLGDRGYRFCIETCSVDVIDIRLRALYLAKMDQIDPKR